MASFGKYQVVKRLAAGGMGEVFLVRAEGAGEPRVLKRVLPHLAANQEFLDLFLDEARIAARLSHPNVVQILELGEVEGTWYLLMEYVAGRDLRQLSEAAGRGQRLPVELACRIAAEAAAGLHCAHRATDPQGRPLQIVHRDVSPHNVLISFAGEVKLIDFGVARAAGRLPQAEGGVLQGKYPYMSPEQASGAELDHRTDQFSLGVLLWELLSGRRLFRGESDAQTLQRVARCAVQAPSRADEVLPPALVELVMRALEKEPGRRFPDLAAFRAALVELAIAQQWTASQAKLAGFLKGLFPDAVAELPRRLEPITGPPDASAPPASLRSAVDGSWQQLQGHEQLALAQLSVLPGAFSLEAAEAVISISSFPNAPWALDVLQALRDSSLLRSWEEAGQIRFGLEPSIREYGLEKLRALGPEAERAARAREEEWARASR